MKRYHYAPLREALDDVSDLSGRSATKRACRKLEFMVLATAWVDYALWDPEVDPRDAMAWAWEDMAIALKGYGDSSLTGAVVHFWTALGSEHWEQGRAMLNKADREAEDGTPATVARRYLEKYRNKSIRTPDMGFKLPAIVPVSGPRLRDWAAANDMQPMLAEEAMARMEELERMGLMAFEDGSVFVGHDGKEIEARARVVENPEVVPQTGVVIRLFDVVE